MDDARALEIALAVLDANPELLTIWGRRIRPHRKSLVNRQGHLSDDERADLVRMYSEGYSPKQLATHFRITERSVSRIRATAKSTAAESAESS